MNYKKINKKLDEYMKGVINDYLDENNVDEIRMYKLRWDWDNLNYENRKLFDNLYRKKTGGGYYGYCWKVNSFNDRFEIWCRRSGMMEKRDRGWKNNSKEIWLVR